MCNLIIDNEDEKMEHLSVLINSKAKELLKIEAKKEHRTSSSLIKVLVENYLKEKGAIL